jgi:hypothetical protein
MVRKVSPLILSEEEEEGILYVDRAGEILYRLEIEV